MFSLKDASALAREPDVAAAVESVDRYLQAKAGAPAFRNARGTHGPDDTSRFQGLAELGLTSAFLQESAGGSALPEGAAPLFAERFGWWIAREPLVENVILPGALAQRVDDQATAAAMAAGQRVCVAWQEGAFDRPGWASDATSLSREGRGWRLKGTKRFVMGAAGSDGMLVLACNGGTPVLVAVPSCAAGVARKDKLLADGSFWSDIAFDVALPADAVRAQGEPAIEALAASVSLANLALAGVLHGLHSQILAMTLDYLGTRVQFERPIGSFQALQHRAADLYTHAQITRFLLGEAADVLRERVPDRTLEVYASRAKARAADAALRIAKDGIQMHGAIGFSDEYDLGLYVKRILVLSAWLGDANWHRRHLAALDPISPEMLA